MLKKLNELTRDEKIIFLEAVARGEVNRDILYENILCAFGYRDFFLGLMFSSSPGNENIEVVCFGAAKKAEAEVSELL